MVPGAGWWAPLTPRRRSRRTPTHQSPLPAERPVGTVVFFHGCARLSTSFFPYHPTACPECIGLPEELALAKQALRRGYAVLALTAKNEKSQCWSSGGSWRRNDHSQVRRRLAGGRGWPVAAGRRARAARLLLSQHAAPVRPTAAVPRRAPTALLRP